MTCSCSCGLFLMSPLLKNASNTTRCLIFGMTSTQSRTHCRASASEAYGLEFNSPIARDAISRPSVLHFARYSSRTSALCKSYRCATAPNETCTPSSPIRLAVSSAAMSCWPPIDQSHAPILNRRCRSSASNRTAGDNDKTRPVPQCNVCRRVTRLVIMVSSCVIHKVTFLL